MESIKSGRQKILIDLSQDPQARAIFNEDEIFQQEGLLSVREILENLVGSLRILKKNLREGSSAGQSHYQEHESPAIENLENCRTHSTIFIDGKRGTGKTTFLMNLKEKINTGRSFVSNTALACCGPIDPTLVEHSSDSKDAFIAVVIAQIINQYQRQILKSKWLLEALDKVSRSLENREKKSSSTNGLSNNGMEEIIGFQSSLLLEQNLHSFFYRLTKQLNIDALVLLIDDTDMSMDHCFEVTDSIRRFISSPFVIPIVTGQDEVYYNIIRKNYRRIRNKKLASELTRNYMEKVFPHHLRVCLESFYELNYKKLIYVKSDFEPSSEIATNKIPFHLITEVYKHLLFWGIAQKHWIDFFIQGREFLIARTVMQNLQRFRVDIRSITNIYNQIILNPRFAIENFIQDQRTAPSTSEGETEIESDFEKKHLPQLTKELKCFKEADDFGNFASKSPLLIKLICSAWFKEERAENPKLHLSSLPRFRNGIIAVIQHPPFFFNTIGTYLSHFERDIRCSISGRRNIEIVLHEILEGYKKNSDPKEKTRVDPLFNIGNSNYKITANLERLPIDGLRVFYLMTRRAVTSEGGNDADYLTVKKLVFLLFQSIEEQSSTVEAMATLLATHRPENAENVAIQLKEDLQTLSDKIGEWRNKHGLSKQWMRSFQIHTIVRRFEGHLQATFTEKLVNFSPVFGEFLVKIAILFLESVRYSEADIEPVSYDNPRSIGDSSSTFIKYSLKPALEDPLFSWTKAFSEHPMIQLMLDLPIDPKLIEFNVGRFVLNLIDRFKKVPGEVHQTNKEFIDHIELVLSEFKSANLSTAESKLLLNGLSDTFSKQILAEMGRIRRHELAQILGVEADTLDNFVANREQASFSDLRFLFRELTSLSSISQEDSQRYNDYFEHAVARFGQYEFSMDDIRYFKREFQSPTGRQLLKEMGYDKRERLSRILGVSEDELHSYIHQSQPSATEIKQ